jgi:deoxyribodipyrimidine photolyase
MPESVQRAAGCRIGRDYPAPLVAYETAREHALAWFRAATRPAYDGASE